jgi:nitric oxide reductase activation protein
VTLGDAATGTAAGRFIRDGSGASQKRGGRAQVDGEVRRHEPFRLVLDGADERNASCMSSESALQTYLTYSIEYCDSDDDEADATMYVIPDEAELVEDEVYAIRSVRPCHESELDKVAFGPTNEEC